MKSGTMKYLKTYENFDLSSNDKIDIIKNIVEENDNHICTSEISDTDEKDYIITQEWWNYDTGNGDVIRKPETETIDEFHKDEVKINVYQDVDSKGYLDDWVHTYKIPYEELDKDIIDKVYNILTKSYEIGDLLTTAIEI